MEEGQSLAAHCNRREADNSHTEGNKCLISRMSSESPPLLLKPTHSTATALSFVPLALGQRNCLIQVLGSSLGSRIQ